MSSASLPSGIQELSVVDRIELATAIWDSVAEEGALPGLTKAQKEELDRRLASRERSPESGDSWDNVKRRIVGE